MNEDTPTSPEDKNQNPLDRRSFIGSTVGVAAAVGAAGVLSQPTQAQPASTAPTASQAASGANPFPPLRVEVNARHLDVTGKIPDDLSGGFYASGPDPQYPLAPGNIPFDGEGHVRLFRIKNGRVDYVSKYAKTERYIAQDKAGKALMPMYRNPSMDDPSVKGLSRSTANTHVLNYKNMILALKEDSPPCAMDLNTLETIDPVFTFDGELPKDQPFTAHPKICSTTGNIVAFGYEADGFASEAIAVFEIDQKGKKVWGAKIKVPYSSVMHDFSVTENHIVFFVVPLAIDMEQMKRGGIHWSWDKNKKTYLGYMRRGGDGKDLKWVEGPARSGTHTMGAFEDGGKIYVDSEISAGNPFPFMPNRDGSPPDFANSSSYIHRLSLNIDGKNKGYGIEKMYPLIAPLPRQDDRYNTVPYRYGYMGCPDPEVSDRRQAGSCYARVDNQTKTFKLWNGGNQTTLAEPCFAPKGPNSREGEGYLLGVAFRRNEGNRSDLLIFDAEHIDEGPIATVHLPVQATPQVHGWWVREDQYPDNA